MSKQQEYKDLMYMGQASSPPSPIFKQSDTLSRIEIGHIQWKQKFSCRDIRAITTCYLRAREWFKENGFTKINTGGGCVAWSIAVGDITLQLTDNDVDIPIYSDALCYASSCDFKGDILSTEEMYLQDFMDLWG